MAKYTFTHTQGCLHCGSLHLSAYIFFSEC